MHLLKHKCTSTTGFHAVKCNLTKLTQQGRRSAVFSLVTCSVQCWLNVTDRKRGVLSRVAVFFTTPPSLPPSPFISPLTYWGWPPLLISTDLFSVTGVGAVCGGSWLGCRDCQPGERYFSPGALAPNLHKAMQLLTFSQKKGFLHGCSWF